MLILGMCCDLFGFDSMALMLLSYGMVLGFTERPVRLRDLLHEGGRESSDVQ